MSGALLESLDVVNFRSIRGTVHAPLDAKVVLVHGENGAGKTSLLSAIELALTGRAVALERADPEYGKQLLNRGAKEGQIRLKASGLAGDGLFEAQLGEGGITSKAKLPPELSSFFGERCYLPQVLLGQLLQIYQNSDSSPDSPLARFVTELLGLDRLDAIETGLLPVADLRNFRKSSAAYTPIESEKQRLDRLIGDSQQARGAAQREITALLLKINDAWQKLGESNVLAEEDLAGLGARLASLGDRGGVAALIDHKRTLDSIQRGLTGGTEADTEASLVGSHRAAAVVLEGWNLDFGEAFTRLTEQVAKALPTFSVSPADTKAWFGAAISQIAEAQRQARVQATQAETDTVRKAAITAELEVERKNLATIDAEMAQLGENSGSLAEILAEISGVIDSEICPVCDRDFAEKDDGNLIDHVHAKVTRLSGAAERLLSLGRNRSAQQEQVDRLVREAAAIEARQLQPEAVAQLSRKAADLDAIAAELDRLTLPIAQRGQLVAEETQAMRLLTEHQSRSRLRASTTATLKAMVEALGLPEIDPLRALGEIIEEIGASIDAKLESVRGREAAERTIRDALGQVDIQIDRRQQADKALERDRASEKLHSAALKRAARIRSDGQTIKAAVEAVRAQIISRAFNDRLNRLWRDLFIRLAPTEPFVPAFHIPTEATHKLKPKLMTLHRSGGVGGTPGAMLSSGNLNTAALTLFIALHLTVAPQLPWLILDDPVQSMDDVHIAHFAALLRTLSKEHKRQVIVAVHDRQLFEYLRLELSPAFKDDSLLTLELTRNATRDTDILPKRVVHKPETALKFAA